jgi:oligoribonuclease
MQRDDLLVWIDLEVTSLGDPTKESIIEIATVLTDQKLDVIAEGPDMVIHAPQSAFDVISQDTKDIHEASGIIPLSTASTVSEREAEEQTLVFIREYALPRTAPLCGSSIHVDRLFLHHRMPELEQYLFYRNIDASTVSALARYWRPDVYEAYKKHFEETSKSHRAKDDILYSIEKLKFFKTHLFAKY